MQDQLAIPFQTPKLPEPEQAQLKCPRCESTNTKFCYYNNYNLSQPRHFCKNCRRYWTKGGALRNIPVGGGSRKNSKRAKVTNSDPPKPTKPEPEPVSALYHIEPDDKMLEITGTFSSLLQSNANFGNYLDSFESGSSSVSELPAENENNNNPAPLPENYLDSGCWNGGWTDLAIYTPGSSFQ